MKRLLWTSLLVLFSQIISAQYIRPSAKTTYTSGDGISWRIYDSTVLQYGQNIILNQDTLGYGRFIEESPTIKWYYFLVNGQHRVFVDSFEYNQRNQLIDHKSGQFDSSTCHMNQWEMYEYFSDGRLKYDRNFYWDEWKKKYKSNYTKYYEYDFTNGDSLITYIFLNENGDTNSITRSKYIEASHEISETYWSKSSFGHDSFYVSRTFEQYTNNEWESDSEIVTELAEDGTINNRYFYAHPHDNYGHFLRYDSYYVDSTGKIIALSTNTASYLSNGYLNSWTGQYWDTDSQKYITTYITQYAYGPYGLEYSISQYPDGQGGFTYKEIDSIKYNSLGQPVSEKISDFFIFQGVDYHTIVYYTYPDSANGITKIPEDVQTLKIYPNPGTDILNISQLKPGDVLRIYSMDGKEMLNQKMNETLVQIDTQNWPAGLYFINGQRWVKD